ncbi:YkgJ family cysteine cluster protein [bacterium]|nr:YkgJ family cysteine cluster protein [bacterium]
MTDKLKADKNRYFFEQGLRFSCKQCGACCTGAPGIVRVSREDVKRISEFLNISKQDLFSKYLKTGEHGVVVREFDDGRCIFFDKGCRIYPVRPVQCRSFPFWFKNLRNEDVWKKTAENCPGIGQGELFSFEEILELIDYSVK